MLCESLMDDNYIEKINALKNKDWQPLFDLIPEIENTSSFGEMISEGKDENGTIIFPFWNHFPIIDKFLEIVYNIPIIIQFDWPDWDEGRKIARPDFDFDTLDIPTKCKLITAIVRNDRFYEGALINAFESGLILNILKSIRKQVMN